MILGAPLLDSSCLFPKPIMAKNVLATGANLFGINYQRICVDATIIIIIIIMNFIKVSCLMAQAQCLINWGDSMNLHKTKLDRLVPSFFDSIL